MLRVFALPIYMQWPGACNLLGSGLLRERAICKCINCFIVMTASDSTELLHELCNGVPVGIINIATYGALLVSILTVITSTPSQLRPALSHEHTCRIPMSAQYACVEH